MDRLFRQHFYIFHLVFLALVGWVLAKTASAVLGHTLAGSFQAEASAAKKPKGKRPSPKDARNFELATEVNLLALAGKGWWLRPLSPVRSKNPAKMLIGRMPSLLP
jgi:hypothetical protein